MSALRWSVAESAIALGSVLDATETNLPETKSTGEIEHIRWLGGVASAANLDFEVLALDDDGDVVGCAPILRHPTRLDFAIGEMSLTSVPIERAAIEVGPIVSWERLGDRGSTLLEDLFSELRAMRPDDVVFVSSVASDGALAELLSSSSKLRRDFHIVRHGPVYPRRLAVFDGSFEEFLKSLSKASRKGLRRTRKGFATELDGRHSVRRYSSLDDVDELIDATETVSRKTYQWHLLGQGARKGGMVEKQVQTAAKLKLLRSFVLFIDARPVAFQIGYKFGRVFSAHQTGFDPEWRKFQPGVFLLTEMFADIARSPDIDVFDFQVGDSPDKRQFSNTSREEGHFYLFPRTRRGASLAYAKRAVDTTSASLGKLARSLGVKSAWKSALRRRSVRSGDGGRDVT